jgi:signal transduction histidine kinase
LKRPSLRIHHKLTIPFTLLLIVAIGVTAAMSISLSAGALETRLGRQMDRVSEMVSESGFAPNRPILERLKAILDADVITYTKAGQVIASTLDSPSDSELSALVRSRVTVGEMSDNGQRLAMRDIAYRGRPYKVAYRPLRTPPDSVVAIVVATSDIADAERAIARAIAIIASLMIVLVAIVSQLIARSITAPVQRLVECTRTLAAGDLTGRAEVKSRGEIGSLARAFNDMAEQLQASEAKLLRAERLAAAGQLAASVAHDIRNPLSAIKMQAQLLRGKLLPGQANQELLLAILREIDRVEWVVKGLLDLVRPAELHPRPAHVNEVVAEALALTEAQLNHRKITVDRRFDPGVPTVAIDPDRITLALLNVILNAADAMPNGGTLVAATSTVEGGAAVLIEISDEGEGIAADARGKVFDPFFTTKPEGVGLGLVNAKSIVERHGGTIHLLPRAERGTRAVITLPLAGPVG